MSAQPERRRDAGQLDRIEDKVDIALKILTGNGDPATGMILQLDRVKEKMKLVWAALAFAIAATVKAFWFGGK